MLHIGKLCKKVNVIAPVSVGTTEVTGTFDTLAARACRIDFHMATQSATNVITTMSLGEGSVTNVSSHTAIATFEGADTDYGFSLPAPNTNTPDIVSYYVDLSKRKRYLSVGLAHTAARISSVSAELWWLDEAPSSDTESGLAVSQTG